MKPIFSIHIFTPRWLIGLFLIALISLWATPSHAIAEFKQKSVSGNASVLNGAQKQMRLGPGGEVWFVGTSKTSLAKISSDLTTVTTISYSPAIATSSLVDMIVSGNSLYVSIGGSGTFTTYKHSISDGQANYVSQVVDTSGTLTLARNPLTHNLYNSRSATINVYTTDLSSVTKLKPSATPSRAFITPSNYYYYTTSGGALRKVDLSASSPFVVNVTDVALTSGLGTVTSLYVASNGVSYVSTANAVMKISAAGSIMWRLPIKSVQGLDVDSKGNLYVGVFSGTSSFAVRKYAPINAVTTFNMTPTTNKVTLSWSAGSGATGSDYVGATIRSSTVGFPATPTDGVAVTSNNKAGTFSNTGLTPGTTYYYSIFNKTSDGFFSSAVTRSVTTTNLPPNAPTISGTKPVLNSSTINLSWDVPATTAKFVLYKSVDSGPVTMVSSNISSGVTSLAQTGLSDGNYVYTIYAVNAYGATSNVGTASSITIDTTAPNAPTLSASKPVLNGTTVNLSWDTPSTTSKFVLQRSFNSGPATVVSSNISSSTTSFSQSGLADGNYVYSIYALDSFANTSNAGTMPAITIDTTAPNAPTLSPSKPVLNGTTINLSWDVPSTTSTFVLQRSFNSGPATVVSSNISSSTTSFSQTGLADGNYVYSIYALDSFANTSNAGTMPAITIDTTPPSAPTLTTTKTSLNGNGINLSWDVPSTTSKFLLKRSFNGEVATTVSSNISSSTSSLSQTGLTDGTYSYYLYAIDSFSNTSNVGLATTLNIDTTAPSAPTDFHATASRTTVALTWINPVTDFDSITIRRSNSGYPTSITDGTVVTSNSTITRMSLTNLEDGTYYFSIFAKDSYGNVSIKTTANAIVDITPPAAPEISATKSSLNGNAINLSWNVPSTTSKFILQRSFNSGPATTVSSNISSSTTSFSQSGLADGTYSYSLYALDSFTNTSNAGTSSTLTIDTTAPSAPEISAVKSSLNGSIINLSWNVPSTTSKFVLQRSFNSGPATTVSSNISSSITSFSQTGLADGTYTYSLYALDSFTNTSNAGTSSTLTIDTTAPSAPEISAVKSSLNGSTINLSWNVPSTTSKFILQRSFNSGPATTVSSNISSSTTSFSQTGLTDGTYSYSLYAVDAYTNTSNAGTSSTLTIDTTAPSAPEITATKATLNGNVINLSWTVPSTTSTFLLKRNGITISSNISSSTTSLTQSNLVDGTYTYSLYALDSFTNTSNAGISSTLTIDTTVPAAPELSAVKSSLNGTTINLSWTVPNTTSKFLLKRSFNSETATTVSSNISSSITSFSQTGLADGTYTYSLYAINSYLSTSNAGVSSTLTIDTTAPIAPEISATKASLNGNRINLSWTVPSTTSKFLLKRSFNSGPATMVSSNISSSTTSFSQTGLADGTYSYSLYAVDAYTNTSNAGTSSTLTIDTTAPSAPEITATKATLNGNSINLSWTVPSTTSTFLLKRNGITISSNISSSTTSLTQSNLVDGSYTYTLYALDSFSNTSNVGTSSTLTIDTTVPSAPTVTATKTSLNGNGINLSWTVPSTTSKFLLKRSFNSGPETTVSSNISSSITSFAQTGLSDGTYTYSLYAINSYSSTSNAGVSSTLTIDTVAPSAPEISVSKASLNGNTINLSWNVPSTTSKFLLKRSFNSGQATTVSSNISSSTTSFSQTGLADGTYSYSLYAIDAYTNTSNAGTSSTLTIDTTAPSTPELTATKPSLNGNTIHLSWTVPSTTSKFVLKRSFNSETVTIVSSNISSSTTGFSQSGLADGTYTYSLYAINSYSTTSNAGVSSTLTIDTVAPSAPEISASKASLNGNTINLSWNVPGTTSKFLLKRSFNSGQATTVSSNISSSKTSFSQTGLADGIYSYSLYAIDAYTNTSNAGTSSTLTIDTTAPNAPEITATKTSLNGNSINLSWNVPTTTSKFLLKRSFNGETATIVSSNISSSTTNFSQTGLADGTYTYSLYAINIYSSTSNAGVSSTLTIDTVAPSAPEISASKASLNGNTINLSWNVPSTTSKFLLKRSFNSETATIASSNISNSTTSFSQTGLTDGTYTYSLYAIDSYTNTSNAGTSSTLTIDTTAPTAPTLHSITSSNSTVVLTWVNPSNDFSSVTVLRKTSGFASGYADGSATVVTQNFTGTSVTQTSLEDSTYYYSVFAKDAYGNYSTATNASIKIVQSISNGGSVNGRSVSLNATVTTNAVVVGQSSSGTLELTSGTILKSESSVVGKDTGSTGTILVREGSTWTNSGQVTVGDSGTASLTQTGGLVSANSIVFAKESTSVATVRLDGGKLTASTLSAGTGTVDFAVGGGILEFNNANFTITHTSGTLRATAANNIMRVTGNVTQSGGTLELKAGSGNLILPSGFITGAAVGSVIHTSAIGSGSSAILTVSGTLTAGGTLNFSLSDAVTPRLGQVFQLISAGSIVGTFNTIVSPTLASGLQWDMSKLYTAGTARITGLDTSDLLGSQALVYPNPSKASGGATLGYTLSQDATIEIRLYSSYGRELYKTTCVSGTTGGTAGYNKVPLGPTQLGITLDSGIYFYVLIANGKVIGKGKMAVRP